MRENTEQGYIDAHDKAWDEYRRTISPYIRNQWEALAFGFAAGVQYGRTHPERNE